MIRVRKPPAPAELREGFVRTERDCEEFDANEDDYVRGKKKFNFRRNIYRHEVVRTTLRKAQHRKCCYCEGRFEAFSPADIEHYRPKGAVRQDKCSERFSPGYYWLAYSWDNLFWCCQVCNRSCKRDFFPLEDPAKRARSHKDNIDCERPLIVDPGGRDDPKRHIEFHDDLAVGRTEKGKTTIEVINLNRASLREERLEHLDHIQSLFEITQLQELRELAPDVVQWANDALEASVMPQAKFSSSTKAFLSRMHRIRFRLPDG